MKEAIMNQEKLAKLQAQVRIGGKVIDKITRMHYHIHKLHEMPCLLQSAQVSFLFPFALPHGLFSGFNTRLSKLLQT